MSQSFAQLFPSTRQLCYLNHAAMAPWPTVVSEAVQAFAEENAQIAALNYEDWMAREDDCRSRFAELLNAHSDDIALLKNTTEGLSMVAQGLPWQAGDSVVIPDCEFPSNWLPWANLESKGVELRKVDIHVDEPEQALLSACDESTRLLAVSAIQYADGLRLQLQNLGGFCRQNQILFCVDAIQQLGMLPLDVQACHIDFLSADAHKWLLGPEGLAVFYTHPSVRQKLQLSQSGWRQMDNPFQFQRESWEPSETGRRFEAGSPNMLGIVATHAALGLLLDIGMETIAKRALHNANYLRTALKQRDDLELLGPQNHDRCSAIVNFKPLNIRPGELLTQLRKNHVLTAKRGEGLRLSPHFYQETALLDTALNHIETLLNNAR